MVVTTITNHEFGKMVQAAAAKLTAQADYINSLNVFPVPDGDTGTNMSMSMASGAKYERDATATAVGDLANALAKGLLMGARGNSGVILSQIFRGFAKGCEGAESLDAKAFVDAYANGAKTAYKAVMKPTEGTILTVVRESAQAGLNVVKNGEDDLAIVLQEIVTAADLALQKTPELLPVLKEVGVVDSGGQGLVTVLHGFLEALTGQVVEDTLNDDEIVKVHVHTEQPDKVLGWGLQFGDLQTIKIDNMRWQQESIMEHDQEPAQQSAPAAKPADQPQFETAVIAVASGNGIQELFKSLGVTHVISGGQTMNPSIEDLVKAVNESGAKQAIILPNNGNIFMAADQAAQVANIPTKVVHAKTIAQGMSSLLEYNPEATLEANQTAMEANLANVKSGEVTMAVRDTTIEGQTIKEGDYMGIVDGKITNTAPEIEDAAAQMVVGMLDEDSEIVTILYGQDGTKEAAERISKAIEDVDDEVEVQIYEGDQPVYPYLISVE